MGLVSLLASFGFYASTESLAKMVSAILPMLDGRSDVMCESDSLRFYILNSSDETVVHHVLRYQLNSESTIIMNAKISIINCIDAMIHLRQQFRLQRILYCFKQWLKNNWASVSSSTESEDLLLDIPKIFDINNNKMNALVINKLSVIPYKGTLVDLLMYESDDLFEKALTSLVYVCVPMKSLLEVSQKVLVLNNDSLALFGNLGVFDCYVSQIKQHFESVREWGCYSSTQNTQNCFDSIWSILDNFADYMNISTLATDKPEDTMSSRQEMFFDFDIHNLLMLPLTWPIAVLETSVSVLGTPDGNKHPNSLYEIAKSSLVLIYSIIVGNPAMRASFRKYKDKLCKRSVLHLFEHQIYPLLTESFKGNREEVVHTPTPLFAIFGKVLCGLNSSHDYTLLRFYLNQLTPDDRIAETIPRNQNLVAIELTKILESTVREHNIFELIYCSTNNRMRDHILAIEVVGFCCNGNRELVGSLGSSALLQKKLDVEFLVF